jgi:hypothetical protein
LDAAKEILQLAAQLDTIKFVMVILVLGLVALLVYLRNQAAVQKGLNERLAARESTNDEIRKLQAQLERTTLEAQSKRENAQIGILSQLAAQNETLLTVHQETIAVLKQATERDEARAQGIVERNKIQAEQTVAIRETTEAVKHIAPDVVEGLKPALEGFRRDTMQDQQHWVEGLKAEARGPLATIEGIPQRLEQHEQKIGTQIASMTDTINALPAQMAKELAPVISEWHTIAVIVQGIPDQLRLAETNLIAAIDRVKAGEAVPLNERTAGAA